MNPTLNELLDRLIDTTASHLGCLEGDGPIAASGRKCLSDLRADLERARLHLAQNSRRLAKVIKDWERISGRSFVEEEAHA